MYSTHHSTTTSRPLLPSPNLYADSGRTLLSQHQKSTLPENKSSFFCPPGLGLKTPPFDDMSTTYHQSLAAYDNHTPNGHPVAFGATGLSKAAMTDPRVAYNTHHMQQHAAQTHHYQYNRAAGTSATTQQSTGRRTSPYTDASSVSNPPSPSKRPADTLIYHSLQIPKCISPNGGNLPDFAAQMTCLFWFQSMDDINRAEVPNAPVAPLSKLARPLEQFRKWVYNVLSTTQVTQNVILLALLFVYRLKKSTPQIKGRSGSEYRLLTVALMLGNKFLDDNTYTNKTWAEVSCFTVQEIHVMEVEFLSNMRYNLITSESEWDDWLVKLAHFQSYYQTAILAPSSPLHVTSPGRTHYSPITSPISATVPDLGPHTAALPTQLSPNSSQSQSWNAYQANTTSPLAYKPAMRPALTRKRSHDNDLADHPAKRQVPARTAHITNQPTTLTDPKLLTPQLSIVTNVPQQHQQQQQQSAYQASANSYGNLPQNVSLPPLQPGSRAMASVYPQGGPSVPQTTAPVMATTPIYQAQPVIANQGLVLGAATPSKRRSPGNLGHYMSSPMADPFGPGSAMHTPHALTPIANSPSVYLQQRSSPYRPIRHVNTLLYPPPSASLDQYHIAVPLAPSQMHYQPLGRRYDLRTGVVPEFIRYNRMQQRHGQQGPYAQ